MMLLERLWLRADWFVAIPREGEGAHWRGLLREACQQYWTVVASEGLWAEALELPRFTSMDRQYERKI